MKILYQHRSLADGAEGVHIREMIAAFRSLGHDVVVEALAESSGDGSRTGLLSRVKSALPQPILEIAMLVLNVVEYCGVRLSLRRHRPDLVYKRHAICDVAVVLAAKHARVPLVLEVNGPYTSPSCQVFEPSCFPRLMRILERKAVDEATLVVPVSTPLKQLLLEMGANVERAIVVPNGANPAQFDAATARRDSVRSRYGFESSVVVGWVGILREWHRVELLLEAVAVVPSVKLLIIGDGPDQPRLERLVSSLHLDGRVHFTGRIAHSAIADHIAAVDIAVVADDRTGYASPMKMLEYMAMERAVVAPRLRNIEDIVEHGRDGLLFTPRDSHDLASMLARLAADPDWRARLGRQARLKIERERNWRRNAEIILQALADRLHATKSSARRPAAPAVSAGSMSSRSG